MRRYRFAPPDPNLEVAGIPVRTLGLFLAGVLGGMVAYRLATGVLSFVLFFSVTAAAVGASLLSIGAEPPEQRLLSWLGFRWRRRDRRGIRDLVRVEGKGAGRPALIVTERTTAVALEVPGIDFQLLATGEQTRLLSDWGRLLAARAGEQPVLQRLQLLQIALRELNEAELEYLGNSADRSSPFYRDYSHARKEERPRLNRHSFLVLEAGAGSDEALLAEANSIVSAMSPTFGDVRPASASAMAGLIAACLDLEQPFAAGSPELEVEDLSLLEQPDLVSCNGSLHRTFQISAWPAAEVDQGFLLALLLDLRRPHALSLFLDPISRSRAMRLVGSRETGHLSDLGLRERSGFLDTAGRRRRRQEAARQAEELASGDELFQFSGWLRISSTSKEDLDGTTEDLCAVARRCQLRLRSCRFEQLAGLLQTLPGVGVSR